MKSFVEAAIKSLADMQVNRVNLRLLYRQRDRLLPFVGAGLSVDLGYPPWDKLIRQLAEPAGLTDQVTNLLATNQFEEAAELVCDTLPNQFDDVLRETFDVEALERPLPAGAIRHIPSIAGGLVITTNFDCALEAAFEDAGRKFDQVFSGARIREASRAVQLNENCLLKLHGDYRDSQHRILTLTEYAREYGHTTPSMITPTLPLPTVLGQALASRPILFLGCSLKTDRTMGVVSTLAVRYPGVVHFALLSADEAERMHQLDLWNIRPLFFPAREFSKIEEFLECLARHCQSSRKDIGRVRRAVRINGYKLFYFRRMHKLGTKTLSTLAGVDEADIRRFEKMKGIRGSLGADCFCVCDPNLLAQLEDTLECHGQLAAGRPDDFLTMYMLFYKTYHGTRHPRSSSEEQSDVTFETKAVVFDFDGTLTARTDDETTWEKIWLTLGYSINDCADLHDQYSSGRITHQTWCDITCNRFRERHFCREQLEEVAKGLSLVAGIHETLQRLKERGIGLYILSGSVKQIIRTALHDLYDLFDGVQANDIVFESSGLIRHIHGTRYDFEGKAQFLMKLIEENGYSPDDVLFVGNSCNDIFASRSGARTLCVNPSATDPYVKEHWTYRIRRMNNLQEILRFANI